tara:strand:- start:231 stop:965 length:735 start_codon:yes stop_codon:yes gene_type:complete
MTNENTAIVEAVKPTTDRDYAIANSNMAFSSSILDQMRQVGIAGGLAEGATQSFKDMCIAQGYASRSMIGAKGLGVEPTSVEGQAANARYHALLDEAYIGHATAGAQLDANDINLTGKKRDDFIQEQVNQLEHNLTKHRAKIALGTNATATVQDLLRKAKDSVTYARNCIQKQEDIDAGIEKPVKKALTRCDKAEATRKLWVGWIGDLDDAVSQTVGEELLDKIDEAIEAGVFATPEKKAKKKS